MATMEADLRTRLVDATTAAGSRWSWVDRPQGAGLPAGTLTMISPGRDYTHAGADGLYRARIRTDCWAARHIDATTLAGQVISAIEPAGAVGGTVFEQSFLAANRDMDPESLAGGVTVFRRSLDFMIWWRPA
jgi:hypothetical protein